MYMIAVTYHSWSRFTEISQQISTT